MATPSSSEISLSDIRAELVTSSTSQISLNDGLATAMISTGSQPHAMNEWYDSYAGIGYANKFGTSTYNANDTGDTTYSEVQLSFNGNGLFTITDWDNGNNTQRLSEAWNDRGWRTDPGDPYEIKWTLISGTAPTNTNMASQGTWYDLTAKFIYLRDSSGTDPSNVVDVTIRQTNRSWSEVVQRFNMSANYNPASDIGGDWPDSDTAHQGWKNNTAVALCYFYARDDGTYDWVLTDGTNVGGTFLNSGSGAGKGVGYWVKWVRNSGTGPSGGDMGSSNTYYQIGSGNDRDFYLSESADFSSTGGSYTITIADTSGGAGAVSWTGNMLAVQGL